MEITAMSAAASLRQLGVALTGKGHRVSPRGASTLELNDVTVILKEPTDCLMYGIGREAYHPAIGVAEGLLLVAGVSDPPMLAKIAPVFKRFQDGGALHGAYGPRLVPQLTRTIDLLRRDPDTRQAVMTVWDPLYDGRHPAPKDVPCTVYLVPRVRGGYLDLKVHMRSNDVWRGWCYDVIQFTQLQCTIANVLGLPVGRYVHHVDSMHVYDTDLELLDKVSYDHTLPGAQSTRPRLRGIEAGSWAEAQSRAQTILYGSATAFSSTEEFMVQRLQGALAGKEGTTS